MIVGLDQMYRLSIIVSCGYASGQIFQILHSHPPITIFLVSFNSEPTPSQHNLGVFMSWFLCDAAKEIVHSHIQPDGPSAVIALPDISPWLFLYT